MTRTIRTFLLAEGATFAAAALVHAGVLISGYEHREAQIAESVIAAVLVAAATATWIWPAATRRLGLAAQWFALLGTMVGITAIAVGVGPRSAADIVYHAAIVIVLVYGLNVARRMTYAAPG